jgi:plastocyanin
MRKILVVLAIVSIVAVACGGNDKKSNSSSSSGGSAAPVKLSGTVTNKGTKTLSGASIEIEQDDFYFKPTFVKATAGATVKVELHNEGKNEHTFTIDALNIDEDLQPGAQKTVEVKLPSSGSTNYYCRFHRSQGMQGAFFFGT